MSTTPVPSAPATTPQTSHATDNPTTPFDLGLLLDYSRDEYDYEGQYNSGEEEYYYDYGQNDQGRKKVENI